MPVSSGLRLLITLILSGLVWIVDDGFLVSSRLLMVGMDGRNICCGLIATCSGLLTMPDEVFEILNRTHDGD